MICKSTFYFCHEKSHNINHRKELLYMPEWLFIVLRSVALLFLVYVIARWIGNKQLSQFNQFEYISGIVLGVLRSEERRVGKECRGRWWREDCEEVVRGYVLLV